MKLILLLLFSIVLNAGIFSSKDDATFKKMYPTPFYKTTTGKWFLNGTGVALSVGVTVFTSGAGAPAAGVLLTEISLIGVSEMVPQTNYNGEYSQIKIPLPEVGGDDYLKYYKAIEHIKEKYYKEEFSQEEFSEQIFNAYKQLSSILKVASDNDYDLINKAIIEFNMGNFKASKKSIQTARKSFKNQSYIFYHLALLSLVENDTTNAISYLKQSISSEDDALNAYLLLAYIFIDIDKDTEALDVIKKGLNDYDDDSVELNWLAADIYFRHEKYLFALKYYEDALDDMTINNIEAKLKVHIANSYYMLGNDERTFWFYSNAISELKDDDIDTRKVLKDLFIVEYKRKDK